MGRRKNKHVYIKEVDQTKHCVPLKTLMKTLESSSHHNDLSLSGLPKAAVVNQNRLLTALIVLSSNGVTANDVIYVNLPLYHTAGFIVGFIGSIETGETT